MNNDSKNISDSHLAVGIRWLCKMSATQYWDLKNEEAAVLLGVEKNTYEDLLRSMNQGEDIHLPEAAVERLSLLLGIWKMLQLWAPTYRKDIALLAFSRPTKSPKLNFKSIKSYLIDANTIDAFYVVKTYLATR